MKYKKAYEYFTAIYKALSYYNCDRIVFEYSTKFEVYFTDGREAKKAFDDLDTNSNVDCVEMVFGEVDYQFVIYGTTNYFKMEDR